MSEPQNLDEMTRDELIAEVLSLRVDLRLARATIDRQEKAIESLRATSRNYYRAAADYVPPPENDYDKHNST